MYSEEQVAAANSADIMELVRSHGMPYEKKGHEYHVRGYGGLYVNPEKNMFSCFSMSGTDGRVLGGKGALAFARQILGYDFKSAMREIVGNEDKPYIHPKNNAYENSFREEEKKTFEMPPKAENSKQLFAYLVKTRGLSAELVSEFMKKGLLYQTSSEINGKHHENGVFLHRNEAGKPCGAQMFGLSSFARFKKNIAPDETDKGFVYEKGTGAKTVYLFESAIDLMSFVQLHPEIGNAKFVSMSGLKPTIAAHYINDPNVKVISCVDNDSAGDAFNRAVCIGKIKNALAEKDETASRKISDGDPPIEYFSSEHDGKKCFYFASSEDYKSAFRTDNESLKGGACFVWKNTSSFEICRECADAGMKDFNDLLRYKTDEAVMMKNCDELKNLICSTVDMIRGNTAEKSYEKQI